MNTQFCFVSLLTFFNTVVHTMAQDSTQVKPTTLCANGDQTSLVMPEARAVKIIGNYGEEVTRLEGVVAQAQGALAQVQEVNARVQGVLTQARAIVKSNKDAHAVFMGALNLQHQKLKKISDDNAPSKEHLANAERLMNTPLGPTLANAKKTQATTGLLDALAVLNDIVALQDSRNLALMKKNEELEKLLAQG